jgi:hypothetical protein
MKFFVLLFLVCSFSSYALEPICQNPKHFDKKDIKHIFKKDLNLTENQLIIYSVNPPTPIDWSTPGKAFKSIFKNAFITEGYDVRESDSEGLLITRKQSIKTHFIGHMFMQLKCTGLPTVLTGMSSPGDEEISGLMLKGKSFNQIVSTTKGHFNTAKELQEEIELRKERVGNLHYVGINLKPSSCEELLKYLTEYTACGVNQRYGGLDANPHKGEGAGCSAFAISFLQRLNLVPRIEEIKNESFGSQFLRKIKVPKIMLSFKESDPKLGAWGILRGKDVNWAKEKEEGRDVTFFDPELFSKWVSEFKKTNIEGLKYLGRDNNPKINGIWFEENQNTSIEPSSYTIDYLKS